MKLIKEAPYVLFTSLPIIAGIAISTQGALNSKVGSKLGLIEVVIMVHLFGLITSLLIYFIGGAKNLDFMFKFNPNLVVAGVCGVIITFSLALSFIELGALITVMISVSTQLVTTKTYEHFGWFSLARVPINYTQVLAILIVILGVVIYQKSY